jgi:cell division protein FtsB
MRDIEMRIRRYRLSRYALPQNPFRSRLRWVILAAAVWLAWAGLFSDHSLYRIWRLSQERTHARTELEQLQHEVRRLEAEIRDPVAQRELAERLLRERSGMARRREIIYRIQEEARDSL